MYRDPHHVNLYRSLPSTVLSNTVKARPPAYKPSQPPTASSSPLESQAQDVLVRAAPTPGARSESPGSKLAVSLKLTEGVVFPRPPLVDPFGGAELDPGKGCRVQGRVTVSSPSRRLKVQGLRVAVVCDQTLQFSRSAPETDEVFRRELILRDEGSSDSLVLEQGRSSFEFSFSLPADVPVLDRAPEAKIVWRVVATLLGTSSIFTPDAADSAWLLVYALPWLDAVPPPFDAHHEFDVAALGLGSVHYRADPLIIAAAFSSGLILLVPTPTLTIFAINLWLEQTVRICSPRTGKTESVVHPRRLVVRAGTTKANYADAGFALAARKAGKLLRDGRLDLGRAADAPVEAFEWSSVDRLPHSQHIRATTQPGTKTDARFSTTLTLQVVFNTLDAQGGEGKIMLANVSQRVVDIASCCCMRAFLALPNYEDAAPGPRDRRPGTWLCMCEENWEDIDKTDVLLARDARAGQEEADGAEEVGEPIQRRRKVGEIQAGVGAHADG